MLSVWSELDRQLQERESQHLKRQRFVVDRVSGVNVWVDGQSLVSFCSNDYLGLASHPKVIEAFTRAASKFGVGSGASHLVSGHTAEHQHLEEKFAAITGREKALLFSTGYMANVGVITALLGKGDAIFQDRLNHASLLDGGLLSGARFQRFFHNDMQNLQTRLQNTEAHRKLICVDGVFSMDGDIAPLPELALIAQKHDAMLLLDDAHGFGVLGSNGYGCCDHYTLHQNDVPLLMCTLGKAMGTFGALVAGSATHIETLIQFARPYIYTTALPPSIAAATLASLRLIQEESWRREKLHNLIQYFRHEARLLGLPLMSSITAIQPLLIGDESHALAWQEKLRQAGFWISAIRTPTVAKGAARLRITFSANHEIQDIDKLLYALQSVNKVLPINKKAIL